MTDRINWRPGQLGGPCAGPCGHERCARLRAEASGPCAICAEPIGYGHVWEHDTRGIVHASCAEQNPPDPESVAVCPNCGADRWVQWSVAETRSTFRISVEGTVFDDDVELHEIITTTTARCGQCDRALNRGKNDS